MRLSNLALALCAVSLVVGCGKKQDAGSGQTGSSGKTGSKAATPRMWTKGTLRIPVIMYHDVVPKKEVWFDLTSREFATQMAELRRVGATVVTLDDVCTHLRDGARLPPRPIALTFDDGTLGNYENVLPILKQYTFQATFFVHTGYVGQLKKPGITDKDHMTWDQLREVQQSGLIDVQPHTARHPSDLTKLADDDIRRELRESNDAIEREMGHKATFFAYPGGFYDARVASLVQEAGYTAAWNEERAYDASPADRLLLPRFAPKRFREVLKYLESQPRQ